MQGKLPHTRHYIKVRDRLVHYRRMGRGPALIMLHASPLTSESLLSGASVFANHFTCIILDNPGYGLSDPLPPNDRGDLGAYARALKETISALKLDRPIIYGASTGGVITHRFGCLFPDAARMLMLDTFSHMDTDETVDGYFPDVHPKHDGSQFLAYWNKLTRLFIHKPWHQVDADKRQIRDLPSASVIHGMLMQQLSAGQDYKHLYYAAIQYEDDSKIPELKANATINVWQGTPFYNEVKPYLDGVLPDNYIPIPSPTGLNGRYVEQLAWLLVHNFDEAPVCPPPIASDATHNRTYVDTHSGQIHLRRVGSGAQAVLLLHDWGRSSASFDELISSLSPHYDLIIPDLPGHGDSPAPTGDSASAMAETVQVLLEMTDELGVREVRSIGIGGGALLGAALQMERPDQVRQAIYLASAPVRVSEKECLELISAAPHITPTAGGTHMISAFDLARSSEAFWRWEALRKETALARPNAMNANRMHQATIDILKSNPNWRDLPVAAARWVQTNPDLVAQLKKTVTLAPDWSVGGRPLAEQIPIVFGGQQIELPEQVAEWGDTIQSVLRR